MNKVKIVASFDYQGQHYEPFIEIDLDLFIEHENFSNLLVQRLARDNHIDHYSYQYEILEQALLRFEQAEGLIEQYINNKTLDYHGFKAAYLEQKAINVLQKIALKYLDISNLDEHPKLKQALIAAYRADH